MSRRCELAALAALTAFCGQGEGVRLSYDLPADARVTLVVEDASGRRVRNLVSDAPRVAGRVTETWDGRDDRGDPVPVGTYRWRGLLHAGELTANWLGAFYSPGSTPWDRLERPGGNAIGPSGAGGWLSDHVAPWCVYADATHVYLGSRLAEAGNAIVQCDLDGNKLWGTLWIGLAGAKAMCTEGDVLYVASDGGWMGKHMSVTRLNAKSYRVIPPSAEVQRRNAKKGHVGAALVFEDSDAFGGVSGLFLADGLIGVVLDDGGRVAYFDRETGLFRREAPASSLEARVARPGTKILRGVATDADGNVYRVATNAAEQCVNVFSPDGRLLRTIGKPGGRREGRFDPLAMGRPEDVAVDARGLVWVVERLMQPKRVSVWTREGELVRDYVGRPSYGGGGSICDGFAYYQGMRFRLAKDLSGGTLDAVLLDPEAHPELPVKAQPPSTVRTFGGRTYLCSDDGPCRSSTFVGEVVGDRLVPRLQYGHETKPSADGKSKVHVGVFVWQDGKKTVLEGFRYGAEWSMRLGAGMEIVLMTGDESRLAVIRPDAQLKYDLAKVEYVPLPESLRHVCSLSMAPDGQSFVINRGGGGTQGSLDNVLAGVSRADGKVLWTYPNPYPSNGHSSPLPLRGELRHTLGLEGFSAAAGGLMVLNGNKGTRYLFTTDGLFVQELFGDMRQAPTTQNLPEARRGMVFSRNSLLDECFGGWFGDVGGRPHLIVGKDSLNICELRGADGIRRLDGGALTLAVPAKPLAEVPFAARAPQRVLRAGGFGLGREWWKGIECAFPLRKPVARVALGASGGGLSIRYDVDDPTPPVTAGGTVGSVKMPDLSLDDEGLDLSLDDDKASEQALFHAGDALDFRWASDPKADPKRDRPVPGDCRFVIAPRVGDGSVVMRYVFVDPNARTKPVEFVSPVGRTSIARVERVERATVTVEGRKGGYVATVFLPWSELGEKGVPTGLRRADPGVIFADPSGSRAVRRQYLFDPGSQEVSDIPSEARVNPSAWGLWEFGNGDR